MWILVISLCVAIAAASYIGIRTVKSLVKRIENRKINVEPPNEYVDLFKGRDAGSLQHLKTIIDNYRNPVSLYRYQDAYEILETKLNFSGTDKLTEKLKIVQAAIRPMGLTDSYDVLKIGRIRVNFENLDQPDSSFKTVMVNIEGRGKENVAGSDSVVSYYLERGYFSISRSPGGESDIFSGEKENNGWSDASVPTVLLFKSRGNSVFMLVGSPLSQKTEVPDDLLLRLINDNN
jgi:hypothetical protein